MSEELRIKIAKMLGWIQQEQTYWWMKPNGVYTSEKNIPDYPNSIEAAMGLEEKLPVEKRCAYSAALMSIVDNGWKYYDYLNFDQLWVIAHATAEQRCKAWVEVMEAKCINQR